MTNEEILAYQVEEKRFLETELGKLFHRFILAHSRYWQQDGNDRISDKRLRELADSSDKAQKELKDALKRIALS